MCHDLRGPDDADLIRASRRGDRSAFGVLFERYHPALVRVLASRCGDGGRAEDAAMDAWTVAQVQLVRFDELQSFFNWLTRIGMNRLFSSWRHDSRQQPTGGGGQGLLELGLQKVARAPFDGADVTETLASLQPADRQLLVWKYMDGYTLEEIGKLLGVPSGTVGSRLWRARERFQAAFLGHENQAGRSRNPTSPPGA